MQVSVLTLVGLFIALRPGAAKNPQAFGSEIGFERLPWHERGILAFGVGADRVGRKIEDEAGALAGFGRGRQRNRADPGAVLARPL